MVLKCHAQLCESSLWLWTSWLQLQCLHAGCARCPWVTLHFLEWQESNKNECLYENKNLKNEFINSKKWMPRCQHLVMLFQEFGFLQNVAIHKLVRFDGRPESEGHNISFVTAHIQKLQLAGGRIVSFLVFLWFFVNRRKGGFDEFLLQLLEQRGIICSFRWSHVQCLRYLKMYTKESSWNLFEIC